MISVEKRKRPVFIDLTEDEDAVIAGNPIQCESLSVSSGAKDFIGNIGLARNNAAKLLKALTTGECNIEARIIRSDDGQRCIVLPSEIRLNKKYHWIFIMMPDYESQHVERICDSKLCVSPNIAKTDLCICAFAFLYQSVAEEACNELAGLINRYDAADSFQEACARIAKMPRDKKHFL